MRLNNNQLYQKVRELEALAAAQMKAIDRLKREIVELNKRGA